MTASVTATTVITDDRRHPRGGIYFDDFEVGQLIRHRITRSVTQMDNVLFSTLTMNPQPLHIDRQFSEASDWGQPLMNSLFTLGLLIGISVPDTTNGTLFANLGMTDVKFPHPLFENDTIHCESTVTAKRESKSRPTMGVIEFHHRAFNQNDKLVAECTRQSLVLKRGA
ncbi:MaoC family dehydratase [Phreatobacter oligotrophus]|uniref:Acyl dehydratase n=1 Tax=Phreatobacter oligotrophus TaxID=1122261 RepID=A0A2T4YXB1_9HYPH|nr:MaoC family dehydratase [Phreatobacter oligotrophus]PTM50633.1 acyl dehydratase [Phreatobacter oligotrophus]